MTHHTNAINPDVLEMIKLGNGMGGTRVGSTDKETVKRNVSRVFAAAKERSHNHVS